MGSLADNIKIGEDLDFTKILEDFNLYVKSPSLVMICGFNQLTDMVVQSKQNTASNIARLYNIRCYDACRNTETGLVTVKACYRADSAKRAYLDGSGGDIQQIVKKGKSLIKMPQANNYYADLVQFIAIYKVHRHLVLNAIVMD